MILKTEILNNPREWTIFALFLFFIFIFSSFFDYLTYLEIKKSKFTNLKDVYVLNQYKKTKNKKTYFVLKLKYKKHIFYTIANKNSDLFLNEKISLTVITNKLTLKEFYKNTFYLSSFNIKKQPSSYHTIVQYFQDQHKNIFLKEILSAIFTSSHISYDNRKILASLGISHLMAISGYHIGIISFLLYLIITPIYKFFQNSFFPYRNRLYDTAFILLIILFGYTYFINSPTSLLRAIWMMAFGIFLFYRHINLLSFTSLLVVSLFLISINMSLLFSISFILSISGVFYIYLFLHYFRHLNKFAIFMMLNIWLFLAINPIVHFIFPTTSIYQLASPLFTIAFNVVYPVELFLHLISNGNLLDEFLLKSMPFIESIQSYDKQIPILTLMLYLSLSFGAIFKKYIFVALNIVAFLINVYIYTDFI